MSPAIVVYTLLVILSTSMRENAGAQLSRQFARKVSSSRPDSGTVFKSLETLIEVVEKLRTEIQVQASTLTNLVTKQELESILLNNLEAKVDELKTLLVTSNMKEDEHVASLNNLKLESDTQVTTLIKVEAGLENQTSVLKNLLTNQEIQSNNFTNLEAKLTAVGEKVETLSERFLNLRATKGIVQGIIAGTSEGVVVIPLDWREQTKVFGNLSRGVAFNWQSRKVYWIEDGVGIMTAHLDGSSSELIISDSSILWGLSVDEITENFYYGVRGSEAAIRAYDSMGKKCVTVASGVNNVGSEIRDIALVPSEGLMFWSTPFDNNTVTRANMDGTNATTVVISENILGLSIEHDSQRLYWTSYYPQSFGNHDYNGNHRNVLLNTTTSPQDLEVDGDTLYFGGESPRGVYSITSDRKVSSIANTAGVVYHMALYGSNKLASRPNSCKTVSCPYLCVLTRAPHYKCL